MKNSYFPVIILILVNLFPFFGVIFLNWNIFEIVVLCLVETFIVGLSNALQMAFVKKQSKTSDDSILPVSL